MEPGTLGLWASEAPRLGSRSSRMIGAISTAGAAATTIATRQPKRWAVTPLKK